MGATPMAMGVGFAWVSNSNIVKLGQAGLQQNVLMPIKLGQANDQ